MTYSQLSIAAPTRLHELRSDMLPPKSEGDWYSYQTVETNVNISCDDFNFKVKPLIDKESNDFANISSLTLSLSFEETIRSLGIFYNLKNTQTHLEANWKFLMTRI